MNDANHPIYELARAAGKAGRGFIDWLNSDAVQAYLDVEGELPFDPDAVDAAYWEGVRSGWKTAWTTASDAYDGFGTATAESHPDFHGRVLRRVLIDPQFYAWQTGRYGSGCCGVWDDDPRILEARIAEEVAEERARRDREEAVRRAGLEWLPTADDALLEMTDENHDAWRARGLRTEDVRAERDRRRAAAETERRRTTWERCAALVPEGATLVDPGTDGARTAYGWIPGRPPFVWFDVKVVPGWPADDPDEATVVGSGGEHVGRLPAVAKLVAEGGVRVAGPEETFPPLPVLKRIGHRDIARIHRVVVDGREFWVGRATFGDRMVLDTRGRLARSKAVTAAALVAVPSTW